MSANAILAGSNVPMIPSWKQLITLIALTISTHANECLALDTVGFSPGMSFDEALAKMKQFNGVDDTFQWPYRAPSNPTSYARVLATPQHVAKDGILDHIALLLTSKVSGNVVTAISRNIHYRGVQGPKIEDFISSLKQKYGEPADERSSFLPSLRTATLLWVADGKNKKHQGCEVVKLREWALLLQERKDVEFTGMEIENFSKYADPLCGQRLTVEIFSSSSHTDHVLKVLISLTDFEIATQSKSVEEKALRGLNNDRLIGAPAGVPRL